MVVHTTTYYKVLHGNPRGTRTYCTYCTNPLIPERSCTRIPSNLRGSLREFKIPVFPRKSPSGQLFTAFSLNSFPRTECNTEEHPTIEKDYIVNLWNWIGFLNIIIECSGNNQTSIVHLKFWATWSRPYLGSSSSTSSHRMYLRRVALYRFFKHEQESVLWRVRINPL